MSGAYILFAESLADSSRTFNVLDKEYNALLDSCEQYINHRYWKKAEVSVRKCLKMYPASPLNGMLFYNLAMAQIGQEKYSEAEESFTLALVRAENNPQYLLGRAKCRMLMKAPHKAMEDLDKILKSDTLNYDALYSRSMAGRLSGYTEEPTEDLRMILRHRPDDLQALSSLGAILVGNGSYHEAVCVLEKAVAIHEKNNNEEDMSADDRFMLIIAHLNLDHHSESEDVIREALKIFPRDGRFNMTSGMLERKRFQNSNAELDKKIAAQYGVESQILEYFLPGKK